MLGARLITGLVLDQSIVDDADAVAREYGQDLAVALALRNHGAIGLPSLEHTWGRIWPALAGARSADARPFV
jgi:hypothetical protein